MFARILGASLVALVCSTAVLADVHRNKTHQFEANFPAAVEPISASLDGNGKMEMARCEDGSQVFVVGVTVVANNTLRPEQIKACALEFAGGAMGKLSNAEITKQGEMKVNNRCRTGYAVLVKYESGVQFYWVTVENGKLYFVMMQAESKDEFNTPKTKNFLESIRIDAGKTAKDSE